MEMVQIFAILFGLSFGSFLNVIIYRLPRNLFFSSSRSLCPHCNYKIPFYSNIPIISFIFQCGKCANCENLISLQYPIIELMSALIWWWASTQYPPQQALLFIWMSSMLITISFIDYEKFIIPLPLIMSAFMGLLIFIYLNPTEWRYSFWGAIMGVGYLSLVFLLTSALFNKQTLGLGDLQLIAITGMWLGPVDVLVSVFISAFMALLLWCIISLFKGFDRNRALPFGPYLASSAILIYILDLNILTYLSTF